MGDMAAFASAWVSAWDLQLAFVMATSLLMAFMAPAAPATSVIKGDVAAPALRAQVQPQSIFDQWQKVCTVVDRSIAGVETLAAQHDAARIELASAERTLAAIRDEIAALTRPVATVAAVPRRIGPVPPVTRPSALAA